MNRVITFSGFAYDHLTCKIVEDSPRFGADSVWVYDDRWLLSTPFGQSEEFRFLYTHKGVGNPGGGRGFGWFSWKPFIIADALSRSNEGDIVLYLDADTYPVADFSVLYRECERIGGIMAFAAQGCHHARWCKRDCFIRMGMDEPQWRDQPHAVARFALFQKGALGVDEFLSAWQAFCLDPLATTFETSVLAQEHPEFYEHRTEQAIYTNLLHLGGHKLYREACQFGNAAMELGVDADLYPQLFEQCGLTGPKLLTGSAYFNVPGESR